MFESMATVRFCNKSPNFQRVWPKRESAVPNSHERKRLGMCQNDVVSKFRSLSAYLQRSKLEELATTRRNFCGKFCTKSADLDMAAGNYDFTGKVIVLMGVSGAGKTTIGKLLAEAMSCPFLDADDFHSESNKEKMRKGIPLTDEDRLPWLISLSEALTEYIVSGKVVVCACSALQKQYREILRSADPNYRPGTQTSKVVRFVLLQVSEEVLAARVKRRREEEDHFMPATLLKSQLELLELDDSEGVVCIDGTQSGPTIVRAIQNLVS